MGSGGGHDRWLPVRAPGVAVLCGYRRSWLRGDLIAGVTVVPPLFFANAQDFRRRALAAANQGSGPTASRSSFHDLQKSVWSGRGRAGGSGRRPGSVR